MVSFNLFLKCTLIIDFILPHRLFSVHFNIDFPSSPALFPVCFHAFPPLAIHTGPAATLLDLSCSIWARTEDGQLIKSVLGFYFTYYAFITPKLPLLCPLKTYCPGLQGGAMHCMSSKQPNNPNFLGLAGQDTRQRDSWLLHGQAWPVQAH